MTDQGEFYEFRNTNDVLDAELSKLQEDHDKLGAENVRLRVELHRYQESFKHRDHSLYYNYQHSMEGIDQSYMEWLETELKVAREFQRRFEAMEMLCIQRGIDTSEARK